MKQVNRSVAVAFVVGACLLTSVGAGAKGPQFRESVTVQGIRGGSAQEHHLTFNGPVALPGVALGPGTYIFSRPASNIRVVIILLTTQLYHHQAVVPGVISL